MDPATHVLFGALAGRAAASTAATGRFHHPWMPAIITAAGGALPDSDYLLFLVNPLTFLADWHQSYTHSLVLLPLWALVLTGIFMLMFPGLRKHWLMIFGLSALGIATHILLDLLTVYGTRIFYPLSHQPYSFGTTFVIDPILTLLVLAGLVVSCLRAPRPASVATIFLVGAYVLGQWQLQHHARVIGVTTPGHPRAAAVDTVAVPQPFSPFHWLIIRRENDGYAAALIDLLGVSEKLAHWNNLPYFDLVSAYRNVGGARWEKYTLYGAEAEQQVLVRDAWEQHGMAEFRKFAVFPVLYRIDRDADATTCVWFSDLRYHISIMIPSFRYGMCRNSGTAVWQRYRLRYFTLNDRHHF